MKNIKCIALYFIFFTTSYAQPINNLLKDVAMPAPNAASLGKFGDIPISPFTGTPNISVHIFTLEEGPLSLPLSIAYHASGIKVGEPASWVGINWALNAGGMITRTVLGKPDDAQGGYIDFASSLYPPLQEFNTQATKQADDIYLGKFDSEPDLFSVSLPNMSFKFSITDSGKFFVFPRTDVKIKYLRYTPSGAIFQWTVTSPDGIKYTFGQLTSVATSSDALEYNSSDNILVGDKMPTSWYLRRIESPDGLHKIEFDYIDEKYQFKTLSTCAINWAYDLYGVNHLSCSGISEGPNTYVNNNYIEGKKITSIRTSTYRADFIANTIRQDLDPYLSGNPYSLDAVEIRQTSSPNTCFKRFNFSYNYFQSPNDPGKSYYKRLRLNSLQESSCDLAQATITIPPYLFTYITGDLPHRLSKAIDHWGYPNGASANEGTLNIPPSSIILPIGIAFSPPAANANREVNINTSQYGNLSKITYPTGGRTSFIYGNHETSSPATVPVVDYVFTLNNCNQPDNSCCSATPTVSSSQTFTSAQINWASRFIVTGVNLLSPPLGINPCPSLIVSNYVFVQISARHAITNANAGNYQFEILNGSFPLHDRLLSQFYNLMPSQPYIFTLTVYNAKATFQIINNTTTVNNTVTAIGGLRINQIRINDGNVSGTNDIIKNYIYRESDAGTASSGILYNKPIYSAVHKNIYGSILGVSWFATSVTPMGNYSGYHIAYNRVKEEIVGGGSTEWLYQAQVPYTTPENSYPISPLIFNPIDGFEIKKTILNSSDQVVSSNYNYFFGETVSAMSGKIFKVNKFSYMLTPTGDVIYALTAKSYVPITAPIRLAKVVSNQDGVLSTTDYTYDGQDRFLAPVTMSITNSDTKLHKTKYKYPADFAGTPVYDSMRVRNMILPIQTLKEVAGTDIDGTAVDYSLYSPSTGLPITSGGQPYPYQFKRYKYSWNATNTPIVTGWEVDGTVNKIDIATGFPSEFTLSNWQKEFYSWNTNNKLIASRTFQNFSWQYNYMPNTRLLSSITDIDGQIQTFIYDPLMRLKQVSARLNNVNKYFSYIYKTGVQLYNYIETSSQYTPTSNSSLTNKTIRAYVDGLGRPIQTISKGQSPLGNDVISLTEYDAQGRVSKEYIPYEGSGATLEYRTSNPSPLYYTLNTYEASPLNRLLSKTPPNWDPTTYTYSSNDGTENVYTESGSSYSPGLLSKVTVTDPDGNKNLSFTDILGRTTMSRRQGTVSTDRADTYTYYDDKNRVKTVIPPGASLSTSELIFKYVYDGEDKLISKDVPDVAAVSSVYNNRDLPVLVSIPHMANTWLGTDYDIYGRPIKTGLISSAIPPIADAVFSYSTILTETSYDGNYLDGSAANLAAINKSKQTAFKTNILGSANFIISKNTYDAHGRLSTMSANNILNLGSYSAESMTYGYDFADNIVTDARVHTTAPFTGTISNRTIYDHWGRKSIFYQTLPGMAERQLAAYGYNHRDFLSTLKLGSFGANALQTLSYTYNDQGWLTGINQPPIGGTVPSLYEPYEPLAAGNDALNLFSLSLSYKDASTDPDIPSVNRKNGNISQAWYKVRGRNPEAYGYQYDFLDRLTTARHIALEPNGARIINGYNEEIGYADLRGNISTIFRTGMAYNSPTSASHGVIDNLTFGYLANTNKLAMVSDAAMDSLRLKGFNPGLGGAGYTYDASGNLISDSYKGISSIIYNHLNLPSTIAFTSGAKIVFTYTASGKKLKKQVYATNGMTINTTIDYLDGIEYLNGKSESIFHSEGRAYNTTQSSASPTWRYEYNIKDHLGNNRISFSDLNGNGSISNAEILQEQHYYPFGMAQEGSWMNNTISDDIRYTQGGKEWSGEIGLMDFGGRYYDPAITRWSQVDPIGVDIPQINGYNYVRNNPILRIDHNGLWDITVHAYKDRSRYPYGIAVVTDRNGNEVYRFTAKVTGWKGRDRMQGSNDTPNGTYDIPDSNPWQSGQRLKFGQNSRLIIEGESGEIVESKRTLLRVHGGRQEFFNKVTKKYEPLSTAVLKDTEGCIRCFDYDINQVKKITDELSDKDNLEIPGKLYVVDDLIEVANRNNSVGPVHNKIEGYKMPNDSRTTWNDFYRWLNTNFYGKY